MAVNHARLILDESQPVGSSSLVVVSRQKSHKQDWNRPNQGLDQTRYLNMCHDFCYRQEGGSGNNCSCDNIDGFV